jgi:hypothetical protein
MDTRIRKQLERATRVAEFSREYPSDVAGYEAALARLEERLARADTVAKQFAGGRLARTAAVAERQQLRQGLTAGLQLLAGIARTAGQEAIGAPIMIRYPGPKQNQHEFLGGARLAVETAREREELLVKFGLPAEHLAELAAGLDEFAGFLSRRNEAGRSSVAARAELRAVTKEILSVVRQLHSINRFRFRQDPAALAAWSTSADIRVGPRKPAVTTQGEAPLALPPGPGATPAAA